MVRGATYDIGSAVIISIQFADFRAVFGENFSATNCVRLSICHPVEFLPHRIGHVLGPSRLDRHLYYVLWTRSARLI